MQTSFVVKPYDVIGGVAWKRKTRAASGNELIEPTSHQLQTCEIFAHLARELTPRGVKLDPNPDCPIPDSGLVPLEHIDLVKVLRTFISHYKRHSLTAENLSSAMTRFL